MQEGGYATFPGESVSIPTLTIPWGRVAPKGEGCSAYKSPRHLFELLVKYMRAVDAIFKILTGEDMAIVCGTYQGVHEASWVLT